MKRFIGAVSLVLILASANALAEQPGSFNATQSNHGGMILPPSDSHTNCSSHETIGDKSELLGTPYYHESTR